MRLTQVKSQPLSTPAPAPAPAPEGDERPPASGEARAQPDPTWTVADSRDLYFIDRWSGGYFHVDEEGSMVCSPLQSRGGRVKLVDVAQKARELGLRLPLLVRFQDILHHRVRALNEAFNKAIAENRYRGQYRGVYPIKVNQLREVVEEILEAGRPFHFGLEVGSKPEMFAGLSVHSDNDSLIVCNGYKDDVFIRTALIGKRLGKKIILIAEKLSEVRSICRIAKEMGVEPHIGVRVRLVSQGAGKWATSAGEGAKFGLSTAEILEAAAIMDAAGMANAFKLLHFHIGSQVPDILIIKRAVREAARYYAKLRKRGHPVEYLDVGGGLAVDYDGSRSTFHASMNYTMEEYARDVVYNLTDICDEERVPHPHIVSESGRALVAHHSVLLVEAFGSIEKTQGAEFVQAPVSHKLLLELQDAAEHLTERGIGETWNDLQQVREEAQKMFELGLLDLDVKARVDTLYWKLAQRVEEIGRQMDPDEAPDFLGDLRAHLADQHICNFSVFQSLLDHWALGVLFPIVPVHRLHEEPTSQATLVDITCDSDGKVGKFIDLKNEMKETLPLHPVRPGEPYYLGIFLTGAYQDIMGDLHNLFGRVNEAHVFLDEDEEGGYYIEETIAGNTVSEVLGMTQYGARELVARVKAQVDAAIKQDKLRPNEGMKLLSEYEKGLKEQTYLTF
ncbi:MAG: biosynthetic arginine decarboxylase [Polyangiaceae bacterium]|nr:biosynthetic arginine decarboxylase [Polyangiaceae bacterium]